MISCWMFIPQNFLHQFFSFINPQSNDCLSHINRLSIVHLITINSEKKWGRISTTAAETKLTYDREIMMMESDIFDVEFGMYDRSSSNSKEVMVRGGNCRKYQRQGEIKDRNKVVGIISAHNEYNINDNRANIKNTNTIASTNNTITNSTITNISSRYFSRITFLQTTYSNYLQQVINQSSEQSSITNSFHSQCLCFAVLQQLFTMLSSQRKLLTISQFHSQNRQYLTTCIINQLFNNYTFSLQQQYSNMDEQSIDQIKKLLNRLYQRTLLEFYQLQPLMIYFTGNTKHEQQSLNKLLSMIIQAQNQILINITKTKRQLLQRRLLTFDDYSYCINNDRQLFYNNNNNNNNALSSSSSSKFENIIGDRLVMDQQIGFGLYRQTIKQKLNDIFSDLMLIDCKQGQRKMVTGTTAYKRKSTTTINSIPSSSTALLSSSSTRQNNKTTRKFIIAGGNGSTGRFMASNNKHMMANNIDRRIQILTSQKRNLQQSLHYEERLQENLIQYVSGQVRYQQRRSNRQEIETISESQEDGEV